MVFQIVIGWSWDKKVERTPNFWKSDGCHKLKKWRKYSFYKEKTFSDSEGRCMAVDIIVDHRFMVGQ